MSNYEIMSNENVSVSKQCESHQDKSKSSVCDSHNDASANSLDETGKCQQSETLNYCLYKTSAWTINANQIEWLIIIDT